jgi:hypothetical protein
MAGPDRCGGRPRCVRSALCDRCHSAHIRAPRSGAKSARQGNTRWRFGFVGGWDTDSVAKVMLPGRGRPGSHGYWLPGRSENGTSRLTMREGGARMLPCWRGGLVRGALLTFWVHRAARCWFGGEGHATGTGTSRLTRMIGRSGSHGCWGVRRTRVLGHHSFPSAPRRE